MTDFSLPTQKAVTPDALNTYPDHVDDDLSSAMRADTLPDYDLVPNALPSSSNEPTEQQVHHIGGARYLIADQSANWRHNSMMNRANRTTIRCILLLIVCRRRAILSRYNVRSHDQGLAPSTLQGV